MNDQTYIIKDLIDKARIAQKTIENYTQEQIDEVCVAIGYEVYEDKNIAILANLAVEETKMGNVKDKITKHKNKVLGVLKDIANAPSVGLIETISEKGIHKYAKPVGVVGALTPVTNPTATPSSNAITILKGRNAVIFAPHPKAVKSTKMAVDMMRHGLRTVNAPEDLIQVIETPSIEMTKLLMQSVDIVLATGGGAMVKSAYSSGKPAYGVGPGNAVQMICEDAHVEEAATKIYYSKIFDYATSCSSENSVIIHESIYDQFIAHMKTLGSHFCSEDEKEKLENYVWTKNKEQKTVINGNIVAKSAQEIAKAAGFHIEAHIEALLVKGNDDIENDLFSQEKLSPILTVFSYRQFQEGYEKLVRLTDNYGTGHSCGIHTKHFPYIDYLGKNMKTSRIMVNQGLAPANGGNFFNGMPSTVSLGCGTWGGNITTENINYKHFLNVTWVAQNLTANRPSDETIFGAYLRKYNKV